MDRVREHEGAGGVDDYDVGYGPDIDHDGHDTAMPLAIGNDERRMHVRAYNYWTSLLGERNFPSIEDLNPGEIEDFGPHSVLLDFTGGVEDPAVAWLGESLREECGITGDIGHISEVPARSLLSRLTDHYLQIIANCAPIGFEAEFINGRGSEILYRGILMPFSSDDETIDFIYGVINWKEVAPREVLAGLTEEVSAALRAAPTPAPVTPIWADGPASQTAALDDDEIEEEDALELNGFEEELLLDVTDIEDRAPHGLHDLLSAARTGAADAASSRARSHAALYRAIGLAHDFALVAAIREEEYGQLLEDSGIAVQPRSPMTALAKLIFGADHDKTRLTEIAAVLDHARATGMAAGSVAAYLQAHDGGLKGLVRTIRAERNAARAPRPDRLTKARARLASAPALQTIEFGDDGLAVLVARRDADGQLVIVRNIAGKARDAAIARA